MGPGDLVDVSKLITVSFPELGNEFVSLLVQMMIKNNFTPQRAKDAAEHVLQTCEYPRPQMARFLQFDRRKRVFTHTEMLLYMNQNQGLTTNNFEMLEVNGKKVWALK